MHAKFVKHGRLAVATIILLVLVTPVVELLSAGLEINSLTEQNYS